MGITEGIRREDNRTPIMACASCGHIDTDITLTTCPRCNDALHTMTIERQS
jgi:hypothetical protein